MKNLYKIFAGISVFAAVASCQQYEVDTQMTEEEYAKHIELVCNAVEEYNLPAANPQGITFNVSSNAAWKISGAAEWLAVTPASSAEGGLISDVTIMAQANETAEDRTATLTVANVKYDTTPYTIVVKQTRKGELFIQPVAYSFQSEGETLEFTVESNYAWKVRTSETWLTVDKASGEAAAEIVKIKATAEANPGLERRAVVTVTAGLSEETFEVVQKGIAFNVVVPEEAVIDRKGGELVVEVNTTIDWTVKGDNSAFTVAKVDAAHLKVSAPFNNKFVERKVTVTVESAVGKEVFEVTQDINFNLKGCEVLEDGSIKMTVESNSRVYLKDELRYLDLEFAMGEKHFGENAQCWFQGKLHGLYIYNRLCIDDYHELRMKEKMDGVSFDGEARYDITQDDFNAIETYKISISKDINDASKMYMIFNINGKEIANGHFDNPFNGNDFKVEDYFFGCEKSRSDGTWFVVTSCEYKALDE